ncbi:hypothetical protein AMS68_000864 [Peltaster fructicola]|uniref:Uncharacterized protein n=1 Tax=Peltaster fructicola TaxID=286661 RepID=A0A6H0XKS8_9PEZI|nr:hypothetical protein AMS68_000864 [Peltaster fructicola]
MSDMSLESFPPDELRGPERLRDHVLHWADDVSDFRRATVTIIEAADHAVTFHNNPVHRQFIYGVTSILLNRARRLENLHGVDEFPVGQSSSYEETTLRSPLLPADNQCSGNNSPSLTAAITQAAAPLNRRLNAIMNGATHTPDLRIAGEVTLGHILCAGARFLVQAGNDDVATKSVLGLVSHMFNHSSMVDLVDFIKRYNAEIHNASVQQYERAIDDGTAAKMTFDQNLDLVAHTLHNADRYTTKQDENVLRYMLNVEYAACLYDNALSRSTASEMAANDRMIGEIRVRVRGPGADYRSDANDAMCMLTSRSHSNLTPPEYKKKVDDIRCHIRKGNILRELRDAFGVGSWALLLGYSWPEELLTNSLENTIGAIRVMGQTCSRIQAVFGLLDTDLVAKVHGGHTISTPFELIRRVVVDGNEFSLSNTTCEVLFRSEVPGV